MAMTTHTTRSFGLRVMRAAMGVAAGAIVLSGCAVYQHRVVEPPELAGPVDREGIVFSMEPLEYRAAEARGRLALEIHNPTAEPIVLMGERSYLVDPAGETRGVGGGTIAPGSYITMLLPPEVQTVRPGPRFGVGVGVGTTFGGRGRFGVGAMHDPWARHGPYGYRESGPMWRWVTGNVRMGLVYERADERFQHDLAFERVKVN